MSEERKSKKKHNKIFNITVIILLVLCVAAITCVAIFIGTALLDGSGANVLPNTESSQDSETSELPPFPDESEEPQYVTRGKYTLNADYSRLLLVNSQNPLPEDYNYGWNLTEIEDGYNNGQLTQIDAGVWPYMKAMIEAARSDGIQLYVWSPYRSFETQNMLFKNQVNRMGGDEAAAATVVARAGESEHNTGLCADFNMADDAFADTPTFEWMKENAADYGFILRYPENKTDITGVIYESWHWRFVGINAANEINSLGLTLEEYVTYKQLQPQSDLYGGATAE